MRLAPTVRSVTCSCIGILLLNTAAFGQAAPQAGEKGKTQPAPRKQTRNAAAMLSARLPDVNFQEAPLEDVVNWMRDSLQVNILVRWQELEFVGVERTKPISLDVRNLRAGQVLSIVLEQAAGVDARLAYRADRDVITITSARDLDAGMFVKVYEVGDVIFEPLREPYLSVAREHDFVETVQPVVAAGAVAVQPVVRKLRSGVTLNGPTTGAFPNPGEGLNYGNDPEQQDNDNGGRERAMRELINVITSTIEPEAWDVNGGRASIRSFRSMLVVRASPLVHQQIGGALDEDGR